MGRLACPTSGCGTFWLDDDLERQLRRNHKTYYCPAGHPQYFPGKTDEEERIEELEAALERAGRRSARQITQLWDQREMLVSVLRRCPICLATPGSHVNVRRTSMYQLEDSVARLRAWMVDHLNTEHGVSERKQIPQTTGAAQ